MAETEAAPVETGPLTLGGAAASLIVTETPESDPTPALTAEPEPVEAEQPEVEADETATADDTGDETPEPVEAEEAAEGEDDGQDEHEADDEAEEPTADVYRYKADGVEHEASLGDLLRLASAGHNYQQKTQKLAAERQELETQRSALEEQVRAQFVERLTQIEQSLGVMQEPDWQELANDPHEYAQQRARWDALQTQRANVAKQRQEEFNKLQSAHQARAREAAEESQAKLLEAVPEWNDKQVANKELAAITQSVVSNYGFAAEELAQVTDHRIILALRDLSKFHEAKSKVRKIEKKVKAAPKVAKPAPRAERVDPKVRKASEAKQRMRSARSRGEQMSAAKDFLLTG